MCQFLCLFIQWRQGSGLVNSPCTSHLLKQTKRFLFIYIYIANSVTAIIHKTLLTWWIQSFIRFLPYTNSNFWPKEVKYSLLKTNRNILWPRCGTVTCWSVNNSTFFFFWLMTMKPICSKCYTVYLINWAAGMLNCNRSWYNIPHSFNVVDVCRLIHIFLKYLWLKKKLGQFPSWCRNVLSGSQQSFCNQTVKYCFI